MVVVGKSNRTKNEAQTVHGIVTFHDPGSCLRTVSPDFTPGAADLEHKHTHTGPDVDC